MNSNQVIVAENEIDSKSIVMEMVVMDGEEYYKIANSDSMRPFL